MNAAGGGESDALRRGAEKRTLLIVLTLNVVVAAAKLMAAASVGSVALAADGLHSLLDSASNVVGLVGVRIAAAPPDRGHPYGHRKFEIVASLAIGVMILLAALEIGRRVLSSFEAPAAPQLGPLAFGVAAGTLVANVFVTALEWRAGKRLRSPILLADARHTLSDVLATSAVLAGFGLTLAGVPYADPAAALVVVTMIGFAAWRIFKDGLGVLVDGARLAEERVAGVVARIPGVRAVRRVRSRGLETAVEVDLVVEVAAELSVADGHAIADAVEAAIRRDWPDVSDIVVHVEPNRSIGSL